MTTTTAVNGLEEKAREVSDLLRLLANEKRLLVFCQLSLVGEMSVTALGEEVRLSQSALSQHLAKLRAEGLVATRREAQTLFYRIADKRVEKLLEALYTIYCVPRKKEKKK
ncbi:MAG: metalloregulator ArsR/SmtB family transcription factor [Micropepsaceae bacterium]